MSLIKAIKSGDKFGDWVTIDFIGQQKYPGWSCRCKCGVTRKVLSQSLVNGSSQSCGCETGRKNGERQRTHGMSYTKDYKAWAGMLDRCRNRNNQHYDRYGGRGISVCEEWLDYAVFLQDMGERPEGMTVERVDNDGNYEPSNCRWATRKEQQNNRVANHVITVGSESMTLMQWSEKTGLNYGTIASRICRGWSDEKAVKTPRQKQGTKQ